MRRFARFLGHAGAWIAVARGRPCRAAADAQAEASEHRARRRDRAAPAGICPRRSSGPPASTPSATKIILVNDRSFNAFVANGQKIFINVGALMDAETPNEIIGVIAHETGHIAGGPSRAAARANRERPDPLRHRHACRRRRRRRRGAFRRPGGLDAGTGAMGVVTGGQELVRRNLLAYQRSEEQAADSAARRYLSATGQSPKGMLDTFRALRRQRDVPLPRRRPLSCEPSAAVASASASSSGWRSRARTSAPRTPRPCRRGTI